MCTAYKSWKECDLHKDDIMHIFLTSVTFFKSIVNCKPEKDVKGI